MKHSTITIDVKTANGIFKEIESLQNALEALKKRIVKILSPEYGSNEWWEKEIKEGLEEVRQGKVKRFNSMEEAVKYLNS